MVRRAKVAVTAGRLEEAYVLLLKYVALIVEKLPKHRDYGAALPEELRGARVVALEVVGRAEKVKEILRNRWGFGGFFGEWEWFLVPCFNIVIIRFNVEHEQWLRRERP